MASIINTNIAALNAHKNLTVNDSRLSRSLERLSSGLRINRAADDAAGLSISEKMRGQVGGLKQAVRNAQDGISLVQTAEGALNEIHSALQRMRELSVQASNDTLQAGDRSSINDEITSLKSEIDRITGSTRFNEKTLLLGAFGSTVSNVFGWDAATGVNEITGTGGVSGTYLLDTMYGPGKMHLHSPDDSIQQMVNFVAPTGTDAVSLNFDALGIQVEINANIAIGNLGTFTVANGTAVLHVGANKEVGTNTEIILVSIGDVSTASLGDATEGYVEDISVLTQDGANDAILVVDNAIKQVSTERSNLGAVQNRLDHTISNLSVSVENITASESRIRDLDFAAEMVTFTRNQIMLQAGTAMLAQANAAPQSVLSLLRG